MLYLLESKMNTKFKGDIKYELYYRVGSVGFCYVGTFSSCLDRACYVHVKNPLAKITIKPL
ncbi:hypothetical protein [Dipodfec virus UOA04_Rod_626]|nr:hypothetical protein [Dipodfec virus UOA04_Rod_626]